ncbi:hypothetical protein BGZ95_003392 [Linnemannia exigua]|uniref:Uncharacterized protein n=1 Tax=Linnemannia exigua TaxID=604196 RepID=A0AAD4H3Q6_9FUNG|nr:hypothetical protein BGZ95_003392 [Linnemannia exigua]
MSNPPIAVDPAHVLAYLSSLTASSDPLQHSGFLHLFQSLHPATSTEGPLRLYIVQQPAPAKHRRSYVEIKDLRALCGRDPATGLPVTSSTATLSDLKDSVLVMRRIPEDGYSSSGSSSCGGGVSFGPGVGSVLTEGTLASYQSEYLSAIGAMGMTTITGSATSTGSDVARAGDGSSDDSSSLLDDDLSSGNVGGMAGIPQSLLGADHVTYWMSNNEFEYLNFCMAMGHSDQSDQSETPFLSDAFPSSPGGSDISVPQSGLDSSISGGGYGSDGGAFDDADEDDTDDDGEGETREGKRPRAIRQPRRCTTKPRNSNSGSNERQEQNSNHTLPQWFRPLVKDGEVQFEIWVVAFLKPQLLPILPPKPTTNAAVTGAGAGTGNQQQQQHDSQWTEAVNELLDSAVLQQFVRGEVADGRIGIDFKRIMADKKDRRKSTRRVIR